MQLDLFTDAPVFYFRALDALGRLDLGVCRAALDEHGRKFPGGPDPGPLLEAAVWLEEEVPGPGQDLAAFGRGALAACRALREGRAEGFARLGGDAGRTAAKTLALQSLTRAGAQAVDPSALVAEGLPWGVFFLWADLPAEAAAALEGFLTRYDVSSAAYLALGDARLRQRREREAAIAYREGYLADPTGGGWPIGHAALVEVRRRYEADPEWGPEWWAVGAYLDRVFDRFTRPTVEEVRRRWRYFKGLQTLRQAGKEVDARLFAAGLLLSESTEAVLSSGTVDLLLIRRILKEINPAAWARHRETLGGAGPPRGR